MHTSGQTNYTAIEQVLNITKSKVIIPIHTENKEHTKKFINKAVILIFLWLSSILQVLKEHYLN